MPEISIIVPVYKVEPYLRRCVDSILAQTFWDFELILVDDGSPDGCPAICDEYVAKDSRAVVIHQQNGGLSAARNAGIDAAQGEFICFVDSDDFVHEDFCAVLYQKMINSDAIFCACRSYDFDEDNEFIIPKEDNCMVTQCSYLDFFHERLSEGGFAVWNKMLRREVVEKIRFVHGMIHEDIFFSSDLLMFQNKKVITVSNQLYYHLVREGGIIGAQTNKCHTHRVDAGVRMIECVNRYCPQLLSESVRYAFGYPWSFVDGIYVRRTFGENRAFLVALQNALRNPLIRSHKSAFSSIVQHRMNIYAKSRLLFGLNVFARLIRLYIYKIIGKDPYISGHGI